MSVPAISLMLRPSQCILSFSVIAMSSSLKHHVGEKIQFSRYNGDYCFRHPKMTLSAKTKKIKGARAYFLVKVEIFRVFEVKAEKRKKRSSVLGSINVSRFKLIKNFKITNNFVNQDKMVNLAACRPKFVYRSSQPKTIKIGFQGGLLKSRTVPTKTGQYCMPTLIQVEIFQKIINFSKIYLCCALADTSDAGWCSAKT